MAKKPQRKNEAEVDKEIFEAIKANVKFQAPEIPPFEIKGNDEPVDEIIKAKEIKADEIVYQKDERGFEWTKPSQSDEWSAEYRDHETGEKFKLKKDKDGNETWYAEDGKTMRYVKSKDGREVWFDASGQKTRVKTTDGHERLYANGVKVADIKWDKDGNGTASIIGIEGECKLRKSDGWGTDRYRVENENYTGLGCLEIHNNGGMKKHPRYSCVYRSDGSLESVGMNNGQTYYADKNGRITTSYGPEGKTEYSKGKVSGFPPVITNPKKEKTTDEKGNVTYYQEDGWTRSHTVDKKGKTTYYTADGQTIDHTVDKNGKETYYTPDGKVDKDKTKAARDEAKKKTAAVLRADRTVSDKEMDKAMREAGSMAKSGEQEKLTALQQEKTAQQQEVPSSILQAQRGGRG